MNTSLKNWPFEYIIANGPEGLTQVLDNLLRRAEKELANVEYYILYELGNQKSLIKVDLSQTPFLFWYYDLLGRPATNAVKEVIAKFLWEKGGEKERSATG